MTSSTEASATPARSKIDEFLSLLREMKLDMYLDPASEEPFLGIPDDQWKVYYRTGSKRVDRWIRGRWAESFGSPAKPGEVREVIYRLEDVAYRRGAVLPVAVRKGWFGDDPLLTALDAWVPREAGEERSELDFRVYKQLNDLAKHHPNRRAWPMTIQDMVLRIRALNRNRMLAAVGINYWESDYLAMTVLRFTRVPPFPAGHGEAERADGVIDEPEADGLPADGRESA